MHTRHVRHDWKTWLDNQDQKSVRTLCGMTSTPKASGIPGVTEQEIITTDSKGRKVWGWCIRCISALANDVEAMTPQHYNNLPIELAPLYEGLWQQVYAISVGGGLSRGTRGNGTQFWQTAKTKTPI